MIRPTQLITRQRTILVAVLAASDVAYRLLLREPLRRALGIERRA